MTRIAFLSTAHIHTKQFLESIAKATDGRSCVAVWDDVADRGRRYAEAGKARFEASLDAVLAAPDVDAFVICAENTRHIGLLERVLPVGKPVFCEKPITTTAADAATVAALVAKHRTPLTCGYFQPFFKENRAVARLLDEQRFGRVTRVRFRNAHHAAYGRWFDSPDLAWFADPELAGGGAMMDMGAHAVHLLRSLFGRVEAVQAVIGNHAGIYPRVDDWGIATLRFASGVVGTVEAAWTQTGGIGGLEVVGSEAALWSTGSGLVVGAPGKPPQPLQPSDARPDRMDRLVALARGQLDAAEAAADLAAVLDEAAIMDAIYAASRSGGWERVQRIPGPG